MIRRLFTLTLLAVVALSPADSTAGNTNKECTILNNYYQEFLYADVARTDTPFIKEVYTMLIKSSSIYKIDENNTNRILHLNVNSSKFMWTLEPTSGMHSTFYVRNVFYDKYLQALKFTDSIFGQRRSTTLKSLHTHQDSSFMWRFEDKNSTETALRGLKEPNTGDLFYLWSFKYNEAFYAANSFFKKSITRRSVYTWHAPPEGKKFYWVIKCFSKD
jgi:hypothetical protein